MDQLKEYDDASGAKGFFLPLYKAVCHEIGPEIAAKVEEVHADTEKLLQLTNGLEALNIRIKIEEAFPGKSGEEAKKMKEAGNKAYQEGSRTGQEGKDLQALTFYTQAIINCPVDSSGKSREFSICLANRSAVLFTLKWFHQAEEDIKLALASGYPADLAYKLHERRARIQTAHKDLEGACCSYRLGLKSLELATKLTPVNKKKLQAEMLKTLTFLTNTPDSVRKELVKVLPKKEPEGPLVEEKNPLYPALSSAVAFKYDKKRGRYAVATRDIQVGETIAVEEAAVSHPLPQAAGQNCHHCFNTLQTPLPCNTCTRALYCGLKCRDAAWKQHRFACKLNDFFDSAGLSVICHLAYKLVTGHPPEWFREHESFWAKPDQRSGETSERKEEYLSSDYRNIFNLVSHHEKMSSTENFHRATFAIFLLRCLDSQGYFGSSSQKSTSELTGDKLLIARLLFHFLELLQFNTHEVAQLEMQGRRFEDGAKSKLIGAAVFPTLALFNHSCEPSLTRFLVISPSSSSSSAGSSKGTGLQPRASS